MAEIEKSGRNVAFIQPATDKAVSTDEDVANAVLIFASEASRQITGVDLPVDGGWAAL